MLVEVVSVVLRVPIDSASEDSRDLSIRALRGVIKRKLTTISQQKKSAEERVIVNNVIRVNHLIYFSEIFIGFCCLVFIIC